MTDKILVIEDDEGISGTLYRGLTFEGYVKVSIRRNERAGFVRGDRPIW
jgi:DNA-binding response OmpR family regulator